MAVSSHLRCQKQRSITKHFYVYCLVDPVTNEIRYIGKATNSLKNRLSKHLSPSQLYVQTHKARWLQKLIRHGHKPIIKLIQEVYREEDLYPAEQYWISYFKHIGCDLTNLTDGGPGRIGSRPTDETKCKISEKLKNNKNALGFKHTDETRHKVSMAVTGTKRSAEAIAVMSRRAKISNIGNKNTLGYRASEETKAKLSLLSTGRKHSDEARAKMSAKAKGKRPWIAGKTQTDETKRKISEKLKAHFKSREDNKLNVDGHDFEISLTETKVDY